MKAKVAVFREMGEGRVYDFGNSFCNVLLGPGKLSVSPSGCQPSTKVITPSKLLFPPL